MEELKFYVTRGIYVGVDLVFCAQTAFYKSYKILINACSQQTIEKQTILQVVIYSDLAIIIHYNYDSMTDN